MFSGGGLNGAAQAGMAHELLSAGVVPDAIVGVSAGALNGIYLGSTPLEHAGSGLIQIWQAIATGGIYDAGSPKRLWAVIRQHDSLDPGTKLAEIIRDNCPVDDISECLIPTLVGTLNLSTGLTVWHDKGLAVPRLMASAAIPGVFPPVLIGSDRHVDGGVTSPVPINAALTLEPTTLIIMDVTMLDDPPGTSEPGSGPPPSSALGVLLAGFEAARRSVTHNEYAAIPPHVRQVVIRAGLRGALAADGALKIPAIIEHGRRAARRVLLDHPDIANHPPILQQDPPSRRPPHTESRHPRRSAH